MSSARTPQSTQTSARGPRFCRVSVASWLSWRAGFRSRMVHLDSSRVQLVHPNHDFPDGAPLKV